MSKPERKYGLFFDVELSGTNMCDHGMISLGAVLMDDQSEVKESFYRPIALSEGRSWSDVCVTRFWSQHEEQYETIVEELKSADSAEHVMDAFVLWVTSVYNVYDGCIFLAGDGIAVDVSWINLYLTLYSDGTPLQELSGSFCRVVDTDSYHAGVARRLYWENPWGNDEAAENAMSIVRTHSGDGEEEHTALYDATKMAATHWSILTEVETHPLEPQTVLICTDLETDDMVALQMLSTIIPPDSTIHMLVGEGNARIKAQRMEMYQGTLAPPADSIIEGYSTNNTFPDDGHDCLACIEESSDDWDEESLLETLESIVSHRNTLIINLKPMREMMRLWERNPGVFENCRCVGYMGFNLRCLLNEYDTSSIQAMLESFSSLIYVETFLAVAERNQVTEADLDFSLLHEYTRRVQKAWDDNQVKRIQTKLEIMCGENGLDSTGDMLDRLEEIEDTLSVKDRTSLERKKRRIESLGDEKQFVLADPIVAATLSDKVEIPLCRGNIVLDPESGYCSIDENEEGATFFVFGNTGGEMHTLICDAIRQHL